MAIHTITLLQVLIITRLFSQEKAAHIGVALLWKVAIDNYISPPLHNIKSDRIVGIQCEFPGHVLLFILGVFLLSACHNLEEYGEYFDYLWATHG